MDEYSNLIKTAKGFKSEREEQYKESSKERLAKISKKKIQTTMIGALSTVEKSFGFLWGHESDEPLSPEQEHMKSLYEEVRSEILDRGNNQARNLEAELNQYDVKWLRYQLNLPVVPRNEEGE